MRHSTEAILAGLDDPYSRRDLHASGVEAAQHRQAAAADGLEFYHILHPADTTADLWTPDRLLALRIYEQFVRRYGGGHLHVETLRPGQYDAECLRRTGKGASR